MAQNKNHHLEQRKGVWYFRQRIKGKLKYKKLSESVLQARIRRDELLAVGMQDHSDSIFFGDVAMKWEAHQLNRIEKDQLKNSTWRDWKSIMNRHVLPYFASQSISAITPGTIELFVETLNCSPKRVNNILVPIRSVFKHAKKHGYVESNIMDDVDNLKIDQPDIYPFSREEVMTIIENTPAHYKPFVVTAFISGMRFGEMAALTWKNIDFNRRLIRIRETMVYGEVGRTKTTKSKRDIKMIDPVYEVLKPLKKNTKLVFCDQNGSPMTPDHFREVIWKPVLVKSELEYRPPIQTRHTFATMMIDFGEDVGWVQRMLGHSSLTMIFTRYYSWIEKKAHNDGKLFLEKYNEGTTTN